MLNLAFAKWSCFSWRSYLSVFPTPIFVFCSHILVLLEAWFSWCLLEIYFRLRHSCHCLVYFSSGRYSWAQGVCHHQRQTDHRLGYLLHRCQDLLCRGHLSGLTHFFFAYYNGCNYYWPPRLNPSHWARLRCSNWTAVRPYSSQNASQKWDSHSHHCLELWILISDVPSWGSSESFHFAYCWALGLSNLQSHQKLAYQGGLRPASSGYELHWCSCFGQSTDVRNQMRIGHINCDQNCLDKSPNSIRSCVTVCSCRSTSFEMASSRIIQGCPTSLDLNWPTDPNFLNYCRFYFLCNEMTMSTNHHLYF